jgi:peptide/nickel transport system substrate-binding protein
MEKIKALFVRDLAPNILARVTALPRALTIGEKSVLLVFTVGLIISVSGLVLSLVRAITVEVPARGGELVEALVGTPRFINPLFAHTDVDRDVTQLLFAGLMRATPSGTLVPSLARSYTISPDGLTYTFTLRDDVFFHDGVPVSADDVLFTIESVQNDAVKSPERARWDGVRAEKTSEDSIVFTLPAPYTPFLENTTLGILPKHLWEDISADQFVLSSRNTQEPIGAGPFRSEKIVRDARGIATQMHLKAFRNTEENAPFLSRITLMFLSSEEAVLASLAKGESESAAITSPLYANELTTWQEEDRKTVIHRALLPRTFNVFFNHNQSSLFTNKDVRHALSLALDRTELIDSTLAGFGRVANGPIPAGFLPGEDVSSRENTQAQESATRVRLAREYLEDAGWVFNEEESVLEKKKGGDSERLIFSLSTADTPILKNTALFLKKRWEQMGARVTLKVFSAGDLAQSVIRPRQYDALLFGQALGRDLDLYAFWHSSQRVDPGLNVALFTDITTDSLLEKARRATTSRERTALYRTFEHELLQEEPAVFLFSPEFVYSVPSTLHGVSLSVLTSPSERFLGVRDWYIKTRRVWPFSRHVTPALLYEGLSVKAPRIILPHANASNE